MLAMSAKQLGLTASGWDAAEVVPLTAAGKELLGVLAAPSHQALAHAADGVSRLTAIVATPSSTAARFQLGRPIPVSSGDVCAGCRGLLADAVACRLHVGCTLKGLQRVACIHDFTGKKASGIIRNDLASRAYPAAPSHCWSS